jgi:hypothetical protein
MKSTETSAGAEKFTCLGPELGTRASCANRKFEESSLNWLHFVRRVVLRRVNRLEITFHTAELREICEKRSVAAVELGYAAARELAERLADIEALDTVAELSMLLGEALCDRSPTEKSLRLNSGFYVVFVSAHPAPPGVSAKATDWKKTTRMKITAIEPING